MTAVRDGFGLGLTFSGWAIDPFLAWKAVRAPAVRSNVRLPVLPAEPPPGLTASQIPAHATWLDHAGVPFLARRFGGAAVVMEQIYANEPCGDTRLGRFIDRQVHQSVAARAVRHRLIRTIQLARVAEPKTVLSVPCGSGRDVAAICSAQESVVSVTAVDPDPWALAATKKRCPTARVIKGGVDDVPNEAFDLILYLGLSEYLGDAEVIRHLKRLERALSPGGRIVTSLTAGHPQWGAMKKWLGWETRRRNPETFSTLVETAGLVLESREGDPAGAQWVMVLRGDRN
jgi:SAM-dependent methyltransferase